MVSSVVFFVTFVAVLLGLPIYVLHGYVGSSLTLLMVAVIYAAAVAGYVTGLLRGVAGRQGVDRQLVEELSYYLQKSVPAGVRSAIGRRTGLLLDLAVESPVRLVLQALADIQQKRAQAKLPEFVQVPRIAKIHPDIVSDVCTDVAKLAEWRAEETPTLVASELEVEYELLLKVTPRAFRLVRVPATRSGMDLRVIGFSCVVPVTEDWATRFLTRIIRQHV